MATTTTTTTTTRVTSNEYKYLLSASATTFAIGLLIALRRVTRQRQTLPFFQANAGSSHDPHFRPVMHAAKALAIGTALCGGTAVVLVGAGAYLLDVKDLPAFGAKMRSLMARTPVHRQLMGDLQAEQQRLQQQQHDDNTSGTKEWDEIWIEGQRIDAERAEAKQRRKQQKG